MGTEGFLERVGVGSSDECWRWLGPTNLQGYGQLHHNGGTRGAHRVSYEHFVEEIPEGLHVCHTCDNPVCVNPHHLFLGTNGDNMADKVAKNRQSRLDGETNPSAKLSEEDVEKIRAENTSCRAAAAEYGVSAMAISLIRQRRTWRHLSDGG